MKPSDLKALAEELTAHMVAKGVRSMKLGSSGAAQAMDGSWHIELELDPAAQHLNFPTTERETLSPKPAGECPVAGCEGRGGWLGTAYCRGHFQAELRGNRVS